jgi:peptide chain release factor subunit 1
MEKSKILAKYEFEKQLRDLRKVKGRATELISLYVPPSKRIPDVTNYLKNEYAQSSNIKSRTTRKNVMWAIDSITGRLKSFKNVPENGLVFLVGHKSGSGDQTVPITFILEPPEPVPTFLYRCDSYFYLDMLEAMLVEKEFYGLIVIDRNEATIGVLHGKRIEVVKNIQSGIMGKHRAGGQSSVRFERLIEISAHEFYKKVSDIANEKFMGIEGLRGVLIGGPGPTKDYFAKNDYLHHELLKKVVNTFDVGYTDEYGLKELMDKASKSLEDLGVIKEKRLMQRFMGELIKTDTGLSTYGEAEVRRVLEMGAVDMLLVSEGLNRDRIKYSCSKCGEKASQTVKRGDELKCRKCGADVTIEETIDIVNEMFQMAEKYGTNVEMVSVESEEGEMLFKAFNGLAAILRYRVSGL